MTRIAVVVGTTRPGRKAETVARWVHRLAHARGDAEVEVLDLESFGLPLLDEPLPPSMGRYSRPHTQAWGEAVARFDGFVFVTPEYNHGIPGSLKNAIDFLNSEWANKSAGFVGYGVVGGARAIEQLRLVLAELRVATVRSAVYLNLFTDFADFTDFTPGTHQVEFLEQTLDQVVEWADALAPLRAAARAGAAA
ncbi:MULTISPECIES: NADPH-dependent FMN reductase [unclassified Geodermatophilus]